MNILLYRGSNFDNQFGKFQYYVGCISGDYKMHGKIGLGQQKNVI